MDHENKLAIITGGTKGLGRMTSIGLGKSYDLALIYSHDQVFAETTLAELYALYGKNIQIRLYKCDVSNFALVQETYSQIKKDFQKVASVLINAAAISISDLFIFEDISNQRRTMEVNYFGSVNMIKAVLSDMNRMKYGRIINLSSNAVSVNIQGLSAYCAAKAALEKFSQVLGGEVARSGITVNIIRSGISETSMSQEYLKKLNEVQLKDALLPSGELINGEEIARAVEFLIDSRQINSSIITVDCGHAHYRKI